MHAVWPYLHLAFQADGLGSAGSAACTFVALRSSAGTDLHGKRVPRSLHQLHAAVTQQSVLLCSTLAALGLALACSVVSIDAKRGFHDFTSTLSKGRSSFQSSKSSSSITTVSTSVSCSSSSFAGSYEDSKSDYIKAGATAPCTVMMHNSSQRRQLSGQHVNRSCCAVADLIKDACNKDWDQSYLSNLRDNVMGWAGAWAGVCFPSRPLHGLLKC